MKTAKLTSERKKTRQNGLISEKAVNKQQRCDFCKLPRLYKTRCFCFLSKSRGSKLCRSELLFASIHLLHRLHYHTDSVSVSTSCAKNISRDLGKILRSKIFFYILGALVLFMGGFIPLFSTSALGLKARVDPSLMFFIACV